jgi:RepB DNA-primase N-terminal domain
MPEREGTGVGSAGDPPDCSDPDPVSSRTDAAQGTKDCVREHTQAPSPRIEPARRYLILLAGSDAAHTFQPYYDPDSRCPDTAWMARMVHRRLDDAWPTLIQRQQKGAAIAVTMAETDGRGRKSGNMMRPRAVWIEADTGLPRPLPLPPTITVETSPGHYHYIYVCRDLSWEVWHGVQRTLIEEYGSDPRAAGRTQVLRVPGTLHQKNPANPHLVHIVEELTTGRIFTAAEITAAFPPRRTQPSSRRIGPRNRRAGGVQAEPGTDWQPDRILSALRAIDTRLQAGGPFTAQGDRPDDQAIVVDWSQRDWWLRAVACFHHASGGSDEGFELSCAASGGDASMGLVGCQAKFCAADQRRVWDSLAVGKPPELRDAAVTIRTIYWIARRYCGWQVSRRGRPMAQPRPHREISEGAQAVAEAGQWAVSLGLDRACAMHADVARQRIAEHSLFDRVLGEIGRRLDRSTGVAAIGSLMGMAGTLGCSTETLRRYLRQLARWELIVKNAGNATSMLGTSGVTIALRLPAGLRALGTEPNTTASADPPILEQTGIATPQFQDRPGRNPSRSPYSHEAARGMACSRASPGPEATQGGQAKPGPGAADLALGDWIGLGVIHAEMGEHLERLADARGKGAVSRVLIRLNELRTLRSSFADVRCDVERASDIAARSLVRKAAKARSLPEAELQQLLHQASAANLASEDSAAFVRAMANYLDAIIREAKGDPDPWRRNHWQGRQQSQAVAPKPKGNSYAAARYKRDPAAYGVAATDCPDDPPF